MTLAVGQLYPVWWFTGIKEGEWNMARIIEILPYRGPLKEFDCILRLYAPNTKNGWLDMSHERGT